MVKIMKDLPENVLGISAEGKITANDYVTIIIPALEEMLKSNQTFRLLYYIGPDFTGIELGALFDDVKVAFKHVSALERIAIISDNLMINSFAKFFRHLISCESRVFNNKDLEEAKKWIKE